MIFSYVRLSSDSLFTNTDFSVSKANRKSAHFP